MLDVLADESWSAPWSVRRSGRRQDKGARIADTQRRQSGEGGEQRLTAWLYLVLAHLVADFMLQPYVLVRLKRRPLGLGIHAAVHLVVTAVIVAPFLPRWWLLVPASALVHYGIDQWKVESKHTAGPASLALFLLDQVLHLAALALVALVAGLPLDRVVGYGPPALARIMYLAVPYVAATFAGAIVVYQVAVAFRTRPRPHEVLELRPRTMAMAQRALVVSLVLFAGPAWWAVGAVPFAVSWLLNGRLAGELTEALTGFGFAFALGLLFR